MMMLNHQPSPPKEVDITVCTKGCYWKNIEDMNTKHLRLNILHMQHHFLCNISDVVIATSIRKYTSSSGRSKTLPNWKMVLMTTPPFCAHVR